jgi:hypothetical protein
MGLRYRAAKGSQAVRLETHLKVWVVLAIPNDDLRWIPISDFRVPRGNSTDQKCILLWGLWPSPGSCWIGTRTYI